MPESTLEPVAPDEAVRLYLSDRQNELADATIDSYRYKLEKFVEWCEQDNLENLNRISGRDLLRFRQYRTQDLKTVSLKGQLDALRAFIKWCESIDAVEQDLHNKILSPTMNDSERERDVLLDSTAATDILNQLARFQYASLQHALLTLLWRCGTRSGTVRSFDLCDYDRENKWLRAKHRTETPLKNKQKGERLIALNSDVCQVLNDYIDHNREGVTDEQGGSRY